MIESFETLLRRACEAKGLSIPQLCKLSGVSYGTLNKQLKRNSKVPFAMVVDICATLDLPLEYFSKHAPHMSVSQQGTSELASAAASLMEAAMRTANMQRLQQQGRITSQDVVAWIRQTGGRLENYDAIKDSIDLFHVMGAEDSIPDPYRMGKKSLATTEFDIHDEDHYRSKMREFHPKVLESIKKGRMEASNHTYMTCDVDFRACVNGRWVTDTYCRTTGRVFLPDGTELTLIHAEFVPNIHRIDREATDLDLIQPQASHGDDRQAEHLST